MDTIINPAGNAAAVLRALPWLASRSKAWQLPLMTPAAVNVGTLSFGDQSAVDLGVIDHSVSARTTYDHRNNKRVIVTCDAGSKFSTSVGPTASPPV